jgi:uncharacterized protein
MGATMAMTIRLDLEALLATRRRIEAEGHPRRTRRRGRHSRGFDRLTRALVEGCLKASGLYSAGQANALRPVTRHVRFQFDALPKSLQGFRILHLSDFHIDGMDGLAEILAERLAALPVDLCVFTGDYRFNVEGSCERIYPRMKTIIGAVRSRFGIVGILGNHDCAEIAVELERLGVRMLINESIPTGPAETCLRVIGVDDPYWYGCADLARATEGLSSREFNLLLVHTPDLFAEAAAAGVNLYLCGHTHAGQIRLPGIGPLMTHADCPRSFAAGPWRYGDLQGYTTAGIGCALVPVRFGCPPEIAVIELSRPTG